MERDNPEVSSRDEILQMTAQIVSAYVSHNELPGSQLPEVIRSVFVTLNSQTGGEGAAAQEPLKPAVSIRRSLTPDYIICLEDGKKLKMLKRHLRTTYGMTPECFRRQFWSEASDWTLGSTGGAVHSC